MMFRIKKSIKNIFLLIISFYMVYLEACIKTNAHAAAGVASTLPKDYKTPNPAAFHKYWYSGKAELNTYGLQQLRYGEMRDGGFVEMVFVTEDFSNARQVKLDDPAKTPHDKIPVLKMNEIRRFTTGIYDYSIMESVFTPVDLTAKPYSLKSDCSVQDWCGQVYAQLNFHEDGIQLRHFSYFEKEGDNSLYLSKALYEDELFNRLRIDPASVPTGGVRIIPSLVYSRLLHQSSNVADATIEIVDGEKETKTLRLHYPDLQRDVHITFATAPPYLIRQWEELDKGRLLMRAILKKTVQTDYWNKHDKASVAWRDSLELSR